MGTHDMNANRLKTEEMKIHWLENEIKDLEYVLSSDCINRNLKLNQLQMYREFLAVKRAQMDETTSDQEALDKIKVKVLRLDFCEASNDLDLVARADVEVTNDTSVMTLNGLDLKYNVTTREYSIVEPKLPSGVCINGFTCRAVTSAVAARYEQIKHSDGILEKLDSATSIDKKEYDEILQTITAHFDRDEMDSLDCLEECKLQLKAANAYINYLENAQTSGTNKDDGVKQLFTEMFETSVKTAVDESLAKIETTCVTALDNFCQQIDSTAYDKQ